MFISTERDHSTWVDKPWMLVSIDPDGAAQREPSFASVGSYWQS